MKNFKEVIRSSTIYTVLGFLPTAVNFFMVPLLTNYLSKEEYGLLSVSVIFQGLISIFINFGLDSAFARFYFDVFKNKKKLHAYYSTVILIILFFSVFIFLVLLFVGEPLLGVLFKNESFEFSTYGIISFFIAVSSILSSIILTYYRNEENLKAFAYVSLSILVLTIVGILLGVVFFDKGAIGNLTGRLIAVSIVVLVYFLLYFRNKKIVVKKEYLIKMLKYGLPFVPYFLLLLANTSIDQWMVERYFKLAELGAFNFTFQLASLMSVFIYSVFSAISPRVYKMLSENTVNQNDSYINQLLKLFHLIVLCAIVLANSILTPLIKLLIDNESFYSFLNYIPLFLFYWLLHTYYMIYVIPLMYFNKTRILPVIMLISLFVGLISNLINIPFFGIFGVVISALIIKATSISSSYLFSKKFKVLNPVQFELKKNNLLSIVISCTLILSYYFSEKDQNNYYLYNLIPFVTFVVMVVFLFNKEIKTIFLNSKNFKIIK